MIGPYCSLTIGVIRRELILNHTAPSFRRSLSTPSFQRIIKVDIRKHMHQ